MAFGSKKGIVKPKFGGKPKTSERPPNKKANLALGGLPLRPKAQNIQQNMDKGLGNREVGFIQNTPKKATAAMMGRAPPPIGILGEMSKSPRADARKSFKKPKGRKVF